MGRSKIFIVDDHPLVRESLAVLINQTADLLVCGEAGDLNTALEGIANSNPRLAIVDLSLGNDSGFDLIRILNRQFPSIATVVFSVHDEDTYMARAIRAGAVGYIVKRESTKKVVDAIRLVLKGNVYISQDLGGRFSQAPISGSTHSALTPLSKLSNRELQVFQFIGQGYDAREIAEQLNVNVKTVQTYCMRMKEKLGVSTGPELLREALKRNGTILA